MLCRIESRFESSKLVVHLAGRLGQEHVPDLLGACAAGPQPIVELDELVSADAVGLDALRRLEQDGATLLGLPQWLRQKLDSLSQQDR